MIEMSFAPSGQYTRIITANFLTCIFFADARCQNFRERFYCVRITVADVD